VAKVRERLAVNKQIAHKFEMRRFNLKKVKEIEDKYIMLRSERGLQFWKNLTQRA
jgi:hypothetical protein